MRPPPGTSVSPVSEECIFYFVETKNWQQVCADKAFLLLTENKLVLQATCCLDL